MIKAAGILFIARKTGNALFLKRSALGDHAGEWCFPGGKRELDENLEECALREAKEEIGDHPKGELLPWVRQITQPTSIPAETPLVAPLDMNGIVPVHPPATGIVPDSVDFTTFKMIVDEEFIPTLDQEHMAWAWAPPANPPEPLHPGCRIALDRLGMNELDIARAMSAGQLTSPQKYENIWLFALRITGTGMAYRNKLKEFVWRDPALYMNEDFLARCNGLAVIMGHPDKKPMMDTKEYADRVIGSIMLPYLEPAKNEVWGIAKINDADAAEEMEANQLSTSPCVVFRGKGTTSKFRTEDGKALLIEGEPQLLDHLAVCWQGVWDKGGDPTGVLNHNHEEEQLIMADEEKKEESKQDASHGEKLDKILAGLDAACVKMDGIEKRMDAHEARMDSFDKEKEEEKKDSKKDAKGEGENEKEEKEEAKEVVADKKDSKKDGEEEKEEKADAKADSFDARRETTEIRASIADMEKRIKPRSEEDRRLFAVAQERADEAYQMFGDAAPRPMDGEELPAYRRRLLGKMQTHSVSFKDAKLELIQDAPSFDAIEKHIYSDAVKVAMSPESIPADQLRSFTRKDVTGRQITSFGGQPRAWMNQFGGTRRRLGSIRNVS